MVSTTGHGLILQLYMQALVDTYITFSSVSNRASLRAEVVIHTYQASQIYVQSSTAHTYRSSTTRIQIGIAPTLSRENPQRIETLQSMGYRVSHQLQ